MLIRNVSDLRTALRLGTYADGGYPLVVHMADGGTLCPACLKAERRFVTEAVAKSHRSDQWRAVGIEPHFEGPSIQCDHCGTHIESAYGDPDQEDAA